MDNQTLIENAIKYVSENRKSDYLNLVRMAEKVCVFGTGTMMRDSWDFIREKVNVSFFCDNDEDKWGKEFWGIPCISPEELREKKDVLVLVMVGAYKDVCRQLHEMGLKYVHYFNIIWDSDERDAGENWLFEQKNRILEAYGLFDEASRDLFTQLFCNRLEPELAEKAYKDLNCHGVQYFDCDGVKLTTEECFVDCGAFDGDTIGMFLDKVQGEFEHITALEMDNMNFKRLRNYLLSERKLPKEKVDTLNLGVWNEKCKLAYDETNDMHSHITETGHKEVRMDSLDSIMDGSRVTFIKMDIEGAEVQALKGASKIIRKQKPRLAICIYHKLTDLWEIPLLLHELNPDYRLVLKHYKDHWAETVCYAY